jgi:hypothetical protein
MAEEAAQSCRMDATAPGRVARVRRWVRRAADVNTHECQTLMLIGKSTLVASISWFVAHDLMKAQAAAFAPFSAVLIVQITVYQSLLRGLRYVGAVTVGVALQGVFGALSDPNPVSFVFVALIAVSIGRWRRLGSQGSQVATAAFFAFSTYAAAWHDGDGSRQHREFLLRYGDFLTFFADASDVFTRLDECRLPQQLSELRAVVEQGQMARTRLVDETHRDSLPVSDPSQPYGMLLAEATRLMEEVEYTCDVLAQAVETDRRRDAPYERPGREGQAHERGEGEEAVFRCRV